MLTDIANAIVFGDEDFASIICFLTDDDTEKSGLSVAVASNKTDSFTGIEFETYPFKK
jgi:hypothetical protein